MGTATYEAGSHAIGPAVGRYEGRGREAEEPLVLLRECYGRHRAVGEVRISSELPSGTLGREREVFFETGEHG